MRATFSVVRQAGRWVVIKDGRRCGSYAFRVDAEEAVLRLVDQARARGQDVEVLVQGVFGEMTRL